LGHVAHSHRRAHCRHGADDAAGFDYTAKSLSLRPLASAAFSQRGCSPRPLQDSPVEAFRYFAATLLPLALVF